MLHNAQSGSIYRKLKASQLLYNWFLLVFLLYTCHHDECYFCCADDKSKSTTEKSGSTPSTGSLKRTRDERDGGKKEWVDPSKAPDPEEPEDYDKDSFQNLLNTGFEASEENDAITLDPCK